MPATGARRLGTRLLAAGGLALLLVGGGLAVATALDDGSATAPLASAPRPVPHPATAKLVVVRVPLSAHGTLDPEGDGHENDAQASLAVDGDAATAWATERYDTFFKKGVGLVLDAGAVRRLQRLDVVSGTPGATVAIRAGTVADGPFRTIAPAKRLGATTRFPLHGVRGRYLVVWVTGIPPGSAAEIAEVRLRARRA